MNPPSFTTTCSPPYYGIETLIHLQAVSTNLHFTACRMRKNEYIKFLKNFIQTHSCFLKFASAQHDNFALDSIKRRNLMVHFYYLLYLQNKKGHCIDSIEHVNHAHKILSLSLLEKKNGILQRNYSAIPLIIFIYGYISFWL